MPIEPVRQISEVWNPWPAAQAMIGMQHLGLERQRMDMAGEKIALDAAEAMVKNVDLPVTERYSAAQKIAATAGVKMDPADFVGAQNEWTSTLLAIKQYGPNSEQAIEAGTKLVDKSGLFRAQLDQHRKMATEQQTLSGMRQLGGQALGLERDMNPSEAQALAASKPFQEKAAETLFTTELERGRTQLVQERINKMKLDEAELTQRQQQMVGATNPTFTNLEAEDTYRTKLPSAEGEIESLQDLGKKSLDNDQRAIKAGTLTKDQRIQAATRVKDELYNLSAIRQELQAQIRNANALMGTTGAVNVDQIQGQLEAVNEAITVKSAELPYLTNALDPTAWKDMKTAYENYNKKLLTNKESIRKLREGQLNVSQGALDEKKLEYQNTQLYQDRLIQAGGEFGKGPLTPQAAAKLAVRFNVKPEDILKGGKMPNEPLVKIDMKQETAESGKVGAGFGDEYIALQKSGVTATDTISKLNRMEQLLTGVSTGKLTPAITQVQALGESLGIDIDKTLPAKQATEALTNEIALTLRNPSGGAGMPGALSDKDREFLMSMTPGLGRTPGGNALIIGTAKALAKRSQEVAKMARAYRTKHGHFDEGFLDELQTYSDAHPLFKGQSAVEAAAESTVAPFDDAEKERRYQEFKKKHQ